MSTNTTEKPADSEKWVIVHDGNDQVFVQATWVGTRDGYRTKEYKNRLFTGGLTKSQAICFAALLRGVRWKALRDMQSSLPHDCEFNFWDKTTPDNFRIMTEKEFEETRVESE